MSGWGTKILHVVWYSQKKKGGGWGGERKKKQKEKKKRRGKKEKSCLNSIPHRQSNWYTKQMQGLAPNHQDIQGLWRFLLLKFCPFFGNASKIYLMCYVFLKRRSRCTIEFSVIFIYLLWKIIFSILFITLVTFIFPRYSWHLYTGLFKIFLYSSS